MAIRPVDLQGAYVAAQQNANVLRNAEEAPAVSQQAANVNFAAQLEKREETIEQTAHASGNKVRPRGESDRDAEGQESFESQAHERQPGEPFEEPPAGHPLGLAGEGHHFIDVTA